MDPQSSDQQTTESKSPELPNLDNFIEIVLIAVIVSFFVNELANQIHLTLLQNSVGLLLIILLIFALRLIPRFQIRNSLRARKITASPKKTSSRGTGKPFTRSTVIASLSTAIAMIIIFSIIIHFLPPSIRKIDGLPEVTPTAELGLGTTPTATLPPGVTPTAIFLPGMTPTATLLPGVTPTATLLPGATPTATLPPGMTPTPTFTPTATRTPEGNLSFSPSYFSDTLSGVSTQCAPTTFQTMMTYRATSPNSISWVYLPSGSTSSVQFSPSSGTIQTNQSVQITVQISQQFQLHGTGTLNVKNVNTSGISGFLMSC